MTISSAWVIASAGSGKTKAVVDRCCSLSDKKIVCLTFTNAAVEEMRARVKSNVEAAGNYPKSDTQSIVIETFHTYCAIIVRRFADWLDISDKFSIPEEWTVRDLVNQAIEVAVSSKTQQVQEFLRGFSMHYLKESCKELIAKRYDLELSTATIAPYKYKDLIMEYVNKVRQIKCIPAVGIVGEPDLAQFMYWILNSKDKTFAKIRDELSGIADDFFACDAAFFSAILIEIASEVITQYERLKAELCVCDFDDVIHMMLHLIREHDCRDVVLYALHREIDHLIIDEAQDLSRDQWEIIRIISENFFDNDVNKTIFAVGDVKQSIYSFRGADPEHFLNIGKYLHDHAVSRGAKFEFITLNKSYRSCPKVLEAVDKVFNNREIMLRSLVINNPLKHCSVRDNDPASCVEILEDDGSLADLIANKIAAIIGTPIEYKKRLVTQDDFMVLVRVRTDFDSKLASSLASLGITSTVNSKISMLDNPVVADMLAMGRAVFDDKHSIARLLLLHEAKVEKSLYCGNTGAFYVAIVEMFKSCLIARYGSNCLALANTIVDMAIDKDLPLAEFLDWLAGYYDYESKIEIGYGGVRITTVHGAKGLQAPIVFVIDDGSIPRPRDKVIINGGKVICYKQAYKMNKEITNLRLQNGMIFEYHRMLYVAMTRSESQLYICGKQGKNTWLSEIKSACDAAILQ